MTRVPNQSSNSQETRQIQEALQQVGTMRPQARKHLSCHFPSQAAVKVPDIERKSVRIGHSNQQAITREEEDICEDRNVKSMSQKKHEYIFEER